jgi:hypothetical protein
MFSWRLYTDRWRVLALLLAISLTLLTQISGTLARPGDASLLLVNLERDLAALRVQLEDVVAGDPGAVRPEVAFNAGIADGGTTSGWAAIATILRTANRRAAALDARFDEGLDAPMTASLQAFRIDLRTLEHRLVLLRAASSDVETAAARKQAEQTLAALERTLADLRRPAMN